MAKYSLIAICVVIALQLAIKQYRNATEFYRNMTKSSNCQKYLVSNRMNVYETIYNQLTGLWSSANCDACAGAMNETAEFMNMSTVLDYCIGNHSANPCEVCAHDYQRVQQFYAKLDKEQHGPDRLCFDIADRMNQTRKSWSGTHNCCNDKRRSMVAFASIASVVCVLPLLFYAVMHIVTVRQEARRISLLSATSSSSIVHHDERSQPSSSCLRPSNGVLRHPEMERIVETDGDEDGEAAENDGSDNVGDCEAGRKEHNEPFLCASTNYNNLDVKESNLINISQPEGPTIPILAQTEQNTQKGNLSHNVSDDESLLL
uniref:Osteopetrosis-associated transmembrane protein 1 n=1 Tax=Anopheles christyi TaxID=43041 RepID=A0A182JXB6_9DIPT